MTYTTSGQDYLFLPILTVKPFIVKYILKRWQDNWDQQIHNKLHEMHSLVGKTHCSYGQNRKEQNYMFPNINKAYINFNNF
jgi:hypothetical protein